MATPTQTPSPQPTPMISPDLSSTKLVPPDQLDAAKSAGWTNAYKMQGPQGDMKWVPEAQVSDARAAKYAVTSDNGGVQRMATPQGQLTYAIPSEVEPFKASGHVPIDNSGNFRVEPLPGEDNTDTMARAATIGKNLPPDVMKKAIEAEKQTLTPGRVAANLAAAPAIGAAGTAALVGAGEAGGAAVDAIGNTEMGQLFSSSPRLYAEMLLRQAGRTIASNAPTVASAAGKELLKGALLGVGGGGVYLAGKWLSKLLQ